MQPVPVRCPQELIRPTLVQECLLPGVDVVFVEAKAARGMGDAPLAKCGQLQDFGPQFGREMGVLSGWLGQSLGPEDLQLAFEQRGFCIKMITLGFHPHRGRRVGQHTGSGYPV